MDMVSKQFVQLKFVKGIKIQSLRAGTGSEFSVYDSAFYSLTFRGVQNPMRMYGNNTMRKLKHFS